MKTTFPLLLFIVFMTLKLTGFIAWSWWWVTAPIWAGLVIALAILVIAFFSVALSQARKQSRS